MRFYLKRTLFVLICLVLLFALRVNAAEKKSTKPIIKDVQQNSSLKKAKSVNKSKQTKKTKIPVKQKSVTQKKQNTGECKPSGCNGEICSDIPMFSACWVLPEHGCYQQYGICTRLPNKQCGWVQSKELLSCLSKNKDSTEKRSPIVIPNANISMKVSSSAFAHNGSIPATYTCDGSNTNPPLAFFDIPKDAKSLVLLMDDPDVPKSIRPDGMWDHWVVWNIPPTTSSIKESETPQGTVGKNSGGESAYYPPCPPNGEHRYFFKLYALDTLLDLPASSRKTDVEKAMKGHILAQAELIGRYNRN